jgi:hypothetical protein
MLSLLMVREFITLGNGEDEKLKFTSKSFKFQQLFSGMHAKKENCDVSDLVQNIEGNLKSEKNSLFPQSISYKNSINEIKDYSFKPNGGWGDLRDRELCKRLVKLVEE